MTVIRRALLSVSDKDGLVEFASALAAKGVELISTGGTAAALAAAGLKVTPIDAVTGFPEILSGRVKTLHPKVHGGLLGLRDDPSHQAQMREHAITPIDLVCVNLYPFEKTVANPNCAFHDAIENIDIGGPSMIRSAAKNHAFVTVVTDPSHYPRVLAEFNATGATSDALRAELARDAFALTSRYDAAITAYLSGTGAQFPDRLTSSFVKVNDLRYGENPHQPAALYRTATPTPGTIPAATQLHGKELSYNNILDATAALSLARSLALIEPSHPGAVIVKHTNPCGAAIAPTARQSIDLAIAGDPLAAYGGILALNTTFTADAAERLQDKGVFLEVIVAPAFEDAALAMLRARWTNVRLLAVGHAAPITPAVELRPVTGGALAQSPDTLLAAATDFAHRAGPAPTASTLRLARFMEPIARSLLSNAVCLGREDAGTLRLVGAGAGQMDRVTSCRLACEKAADSARGSLAYSDAFFPFADGPEILIAAGVTTIVHPGGSKRDDDTFALCNSKGVTCLTTGIRHFRH